MTGARGRIGVVGAGAMGSGIAQVAASAGHEVLLADALPGAAERARASIANVLGRLVEKGKLSAEERAAIVGRVHALAQPLGDDVRAFASCDLVIEAIVEDLAVKRTLFTALDALLSERAMLATNTSSLSIAAIAGACRHPSRVIGIHFFNPAPVLPLVEVVPSLATSPAVLTRARELVASWKKTVVIASDTPGFIVNRIARPFYGESLRLLEEGIADVATIDWALREIGGFRMGPFELMDFIGNDVNYAVTRSVFEALYYDPRYRPALTQRRLVEAGFLGRKTGRGYYKYQNGAPDPAPAPRVDPALGRAIVERVVAMLINEAVDAVHLRVASPRDIETAMTKGVNYPRGLLAWANETGLATLLERLVALQEEYGEDRYRPSPLLRRMVREHAQFVI